MPVMNFNTESALVSKRRVSIYTPVLSLLRFGGLRFKEHMLDDKVLLDCKCVLAAYHNEGAVPS